MPAFTGGHFPFLKAFGRSKSVWLGARDLSKIGSLNERFQFGYDV